MDFIEIKYKLWCIIKINIIIGIMNNKKKRSLKTTKTGWAARIIGSLAGPASLFFPDKACQETYGPYQHYL
jgi:hypothetical protein